MADTGTRGQRLRTAGRSVAAAVTLGLLMASGASAGVMPVDARSARSAGEGLPPPAGGGSPLYLELPPRPPYQATDRTRQTGNGSSGSQLPPDRSPRPAGIPATVLAAYQQAADRLAGERPSCGVSVPLLAAIGRVESNHARGGSLDHTGRARTPIIGPRLDGGPGVATIHDTDGGRLDGDPVHDRAVGPMQFIPSTWAGWGADGNRDGVADPQNVYDSTLAAARYLCAAGGDLTVVSGLHRAIRAYNRPDHYLRAVLSWMGVYSGDPVAVPDSAAAGGDQPPPAREDRAADADPAGRDEPESPSSGDAPSGAEPDREQAAREPDDRDDPTRTDPVQDAADLLEPDDELLDGDELDDELDGETPVDPPSLPG